MVRKSGLIIIIKKKDRLNLEATQRNWEDKEELAKVKKKCPEI